MDAEEVRSIIESEPTRARKIRAFGALLGRESGLGAEGLTIVGGSALEVYTEGEYASDDLDVVASDRKRLERTLQGWGFRNRGMYWVSDRLPFLMQVVGSYDRAGRTHSLVFSTPHGRVRVTSLEYVLVKRLVEARYWTRPEAYAEALLGARRNTGRIDWDHLQTLAAQESVGDMVDEFRRRATNATESQRIRRLREE